MEKLNNIFFALMTRGPDGTMLCFLQGLQSLKTRHWILLFANSSSYCLDGAADISEVSGKEPAEQQQSKKGRGRRQWCLPCSSFPSENSQLGWWIDVIWLLSRQWYTQGILNDLGHFPVQNQNIMLNLSWILQIKETLNPWPLISHMRRLSSVFPIVGEYARIICMILTLSCVLRMGTQGILQSIPNTWYRATMAMMMQCGRAAGLSWYGS